MPPICPSSTSGRLKWTLPGPLNSAISVLSDGRAPTGRSEPYFQQTLAGGKWHPVSLEPISETPRSTITVKVSEFDSWAQDWEECHDHADPDDPECVFAASDADEPGELLRCCGEQRPEPPQPLVITATSKEYVTVHDYVSAIHAWLTEHFTEISSALHVWDGDQQPPNEKLVVNYDNLESLAIVDENMWTQVHQAPVQPDITTRPGAVPDPRRILAMRATPDDVRRLNEQLRREGSAVQYDENWSHNYQSCS